jgi:hypothetical protein
MAQNSVENQGINFYVQVRENSGKQHTKRTRESVEKSGNSKKCMKPTVPVRWVLAAPPMSLA